MKYQYNRQVITIERQLTRVTPELKDFIFFNIRHRRFTWNKFVEESRRVGLGAFDPFVFKKYFHENYELDGVCKDPRYCVGIAEAVMKNAVKGKKRCFADTKKTHRFHELQFNEFDKYHGCFEVHNKATLTSANKISSRILFKDGRTLAFRAQINNYIPLTVKEPFFTERTKEKKTKNHHMTLELKSSKKHVSYYYQMLDIKKVIFRHRLGRFYILLVVDALITSVDQCKRLPKAGIDLGIRNPIMIWDKYGAASFRMSDKDLARIKYLERRTSRLKSIMDRKAEQNMKLGNPVYSRNYERVRKKFRITWRKIVNIRTEWCYRICKEIALTYKKIVVDKFYIPKQTLNSKFPRAVQRKLNHYNRIHAMSRVMEYLPYACVKYGCIYEKAPENTTCRCSNCGHLNPHIPLEERFLDCEECSAHIDRDVNAAKNCYAFA